MSYEATRWAAGEAVRTGRREARTAQWRPGIDPAELHPDDVLVLHGTRHRLGTVTHDRVEGTGEVTRAAAYSLRIGRWIDLLTGEIRRVEGDPEPALAPADIPAWPVTICSIWPHEAHGDCTGVDGGSGAVGDATAEAAALSPAGPEPVYPAPGSAIPNQPGYVVGECEHRVARSEWAAGLRRCERC